MSCAQCGVDCDDGDIQQYSRCFTSASNDRKCSVFNELTLTCPEDHTFLGISTCRTAECVNETIDDIRTFCVECQRKSAEVPPTAVRDDDWFESPILLTSIVIVAFFMLIAYALSDNPERSKGFSRIIRSFYPNKGTSTKRVSIDLSSTADPQVEAIDMVEPKAHQKSFVRGAYI